MGLYCYGTRILSIQSKITLIIKPSTSSEHSSTPSWRGRRISRAISVVHRFLVSGGGRRVLLSPSSQQPYSVWKPGNDYFVSATSTGWLFCFCKFKLVIQVINLLKIFLKPFIINFPLDFGCWFLPGSLRINRVEQWVTDGGCDTTGGARLPQPHFWGRICAARFTIWANFISYQIRKWMEEWKKQRWSCSVMIPAFRRRRSSQPGHLDFLNALWDLSLVFSSGDHLF